MADYRAVATLQEFKSSIEDAYRLSLAQPHPVCIAGTHSMDTNLSTIMCSTLVGGQYFYMIIRTSFPLGEEVFDYTEALQYKLLDNGRLVAYLDWHEVTHVVAIPVPLFDACTKLPVVKDYGARGTDEEVMLLMLQHGGGSMRRILPKIWGHVQYAGNVGQPEDDR
jgi:hypothetical protein